MANALCNTRVLYRSPPRKKKTPVATPTADSNNTHRQRVERRTVGEMIETKCERRGHDGNAGRHEPGSEGVAEKGTAQDPADDDLGD